MPFSSVIHMTDCMDVWMCIFQCIKFHPQLKIFVYICDIEIYIVFFFLFSVFFSCTFVSNLFTEASNQNSKSATIEMYAPSSYNDTVTGETLSSVSEKSDSYSNEGSQPDYMVSLRLFSFYDWTICKTFSERRKCEHMIDRLKLNRTETKTQSNWYESTAYTKTETPIIWAIRKDARIIQWIRFGSIEHTEQMPI